MDRSEILEMLRVLQLSGMRAAYDEIVTAAIKRQHSVEKVIGALLKAEIAEKRARSIRYQMAAANLPAQKELAGWRSFEPADEEESKGSASLEHGRGCRRSCARARPPDAGPSHCLGAQSCG